MSFFLVCGLDRVRLVNLIEVVCELVDTVFSDSLKYVVHISEPHLEFAVQRRGSDSLLLQVLLLHINIGSNRRNEAAHGCAEE